MDPRALFVQALSLGSVATAAPSAEPPPEANDFDFYVAHQVIYDSNLYRLADGTDELLAQHGPNAQRDDLLQRTTAGLHGEWALSQQLLTVTGQVDFNRFRHNDDLDNTGGRSTLVWDWRLGQRGSGELGADYLRTLTDFASTRVFEKDIIERAAGWWNGELRLGGRWSLQAGAKLTDIEHSAAARRFDDMRITTYTGGAKYRTDLGNAFAWEYRRTEGDSRAPAQLATVDRSYVEDAGLFKAQYFFTTKTSIAASAGYVRRDYDDARFADSGFSGSVWDAVLQWSPTVKTSFVLSAWRTLRAYIDAESDYFVATGGGLTVRWAPQEKFESSLQVSYEDREYLGTGDPSLDRRADALSLAELALSYSPTRFLKFELSGRYEERDSNRVFQAYDAMRVGLSVQVTL